MGRRGNQELKHIVDDGIVTYMVNLPSALRKTIKVLAAREGITMNDFFITAIEKEIAAVVANARRDT